MKILPKWARIVGVLLLSSFLDGFADEPRKSSEESAAELRHAQEQLSNAIPSKPEVRHQNRFAEMKREVRERIRVLEEVASEDPMLKARCKNELSALSTLGLQIDQGGPQTDQKGRSLTSNATEAIMRRAGMLAEFVEYVFEARKKMAFEKVERLTQANWLIADLKTPPRSNPLGASANHREDPKESKRRAQLESQKRRERDLIVKGPNTDLLSKELSKLEEISSSLDPWMQGYSKFLDAHPNYFKKTSTRSDAIDTMNKFTASIGSPEDPDDLYERNYREEVREAIDQLNAPPKTPEK